MSTIPFGKIRAVALAQARSLLFAWFPAGRIIGNEFKVGSIHGDPGESLSINLITGRWADFNNPAHRGADLIDVRAIGFHGGDLKAAALELAQVLGIPINGAIPKSAGPKPKSAPKARPQKPEAAKGWQPCVPPPPGTPPPSAWLLGRFDKIHKYTDLGGHTTHFVCRVEARDGRKKTFIPLTFGNLDGETGWHQRAVGNPKPLFGLNRLSAFPDAPVLLTEGEKAADCAQAMFPGYAAMSWCGGVGSVQHADLAPIKDRKIIIWPDADDPGKKAGAWIAAQMPGSRVLPVDDLPDGFDAADLRVDDPAAWLAERLDKTDQAKPTAGAEAEPANPPPPEPPPEPPPDEPPHSDDPDFEPAELPGLFSRTSAGIWFTPPGGGDGDAPEPVFVCAPFDVLAETQDEAGASWGLLLQWRDRDNQQHRWAVPRKLLHAEGNAIAAELEDAGLSVGTGKRPHDLLKLLLSQIATPNRMQCVKRAGWHQAGDGHVFVLADGEIVGPGAGRIAMQSERASISGGPGTQSRGTLLDWQNSVGRLAVGNHRVGLLMAAALAGPLLNFCSEPSGGIHIHGQSQNGKTTSLVAAASIWGKGDMSGRVRSWRATANAFEGVAAESCDSLLALDEIGQADGKEVGEVVYLLANEGGKGRANRDGTARARTTWRLIFISTGEVPLAVKMGERGGRPQAGQEVRLVSVPANAGGKFGVFQELHKMASPGAFASHLREASRQSYGTAGRAFVTKLAHQWSTDAASLAAFVAAQTGAFTKEHVLTGADGQVSSVARRFALIAAAGELGVVYGVLPWPKGEATTAAAAGFRAWLAERGGSGASEDTQAISQVRQFIETHGESRFTTIFTSPGQLPDSDETDDRGTFNRAGFRRETEGVWEYYILPEAWKAEVCKGLDAIRVANLLLERGLLETAKDDANRHLSVKVQIKGYGRPRVYRIKGSILSGDGDGEQASS